MIRLLIFLTFITPSTNSFGLGPNVEDLNVEIEFVRTCLLGFGFFPKLDEVIAYRGDSRHPMELQKAGGFFRKAFGDKTKIPSFRVDGGARHMIGCSLDFNVAAGFSQYSVDVQRGLKGASDSGWVYAFFLGSGSYYDPKDYPHAFLADWGHELDAAYIPFDHIIGAIHIKSPGKLCIHCYLTHIPDHLHSIRGCEGRYEAQVKLEVDAIWINEETAASLNCEEKQNVQQKLMQLYANGFYNVKPEDEKSIHGMRVTQKYEAYFPLCAPFLCNDVELTAILNPEPTIVYLKNIL